MKVAQATAEPGSLQSDEYFLPVQFLIVLCGSAVILSNTSWSDFSRQFMWIFFGLLTAILLYTMKINVIRMISPFFFIFCLLLILSPHSGFVPLFRSNSLRWINVFGFSVQVSEPMRLGVVLCLADLYARIAKEKKPHRLLTLLPLVVGLLCVTASYLIDDFSTTAYLGGLCLLMFLIGGDRRNSIVFFVMLLIVAMIAMFFSENDFRKDRWAEFIGSSGEQLVHVYEAIAFGGVFGVGIGEGVINKTIPVGVHDFPLASVGEETGLIGIIFVLLLFLAFVLICYWRALSTNNYYEKILVLGLASALFFQAFINFLVTGGLAPVTGQPIPFFSVGGSCTFVSLMIFGVLNNVFSRKRKVIRRRR